MGKKFKSKLFPRKAKESEKLVTTVKRYTRFYINCSVDHAAYSDWTIQHLFKESLLYSINPISCRY